MPAPAHDDQVRPLARLEMPYLALQPLTSRNLNPSPAHDDQVRLWTAWKRPFCPHPGTSTPLPDPSSALPGQPFVSLDAPPFHSALAHTQPPTALPLDRSLP